VPKPNPPHTEAAPDGLSPASSSRSDGSTRYLVLVCLVASLGGLLFGFDTAVISGTIEAVRRQFGLTAFLEGWFTSSALAGCLLGAAIAGAFTDRFGRRPALGVAAVLFFVSALYSTIPRTFEVLAWARLIGGIGVGLASVVAPMYIAEFSLPRWRGRLVACYQLSIVIGILAAYLSNWSIRRLATSQPEALGGQGWLHTVRIRESWRGMFGAEMIPGALFLLLLGLVPESPRWLFQSGQSERARQILTRVRGATEASREAEEIQKALATEVRSVRELLRPGLRRALLVGVMLSVFGQLSGVNLVVYYGPKILLAAGYQDLGALLGQVGFGLINLVFTVLALLLIDRWGRRPLLIGGMSVVTAALAVVGTLFLLGSANPVAEGGEAGVVVSRAVGLWIGIAMCVYMACIALSICAVIWVLTPEIFPNRLRARAAPIATFANWTTNCLSALVFPWYVAHMGMHTVFFTTAAICLVATLFFHRCVPETKDRTLEEIERFWTSPER